MHCVRLSTGNFVVSQNNNNHQICILNTDGQIIHLYRRSGKSGIGQLNGSLQLTIDTHNNVLVADFDNNKVCIFSSTLTHLGDVDIPGHRLNGPYAVHFDRENNQLYILEFRGKRVCVVGIDYQ